MNGQNKRNGDASKSPIGYRPTPTRVSGPSRSVHLDQCPFDESQ
jgi:hypothetical protein